MEHKDLPVWSWQVNSAMIERITLIGPMKDGQRALEWLHEQGYRTIRSGPYTNKEMHPKYDISRFLFIAERDHSTLT